MRPYLKTLTIITTFICAASSTSGRRLTNAAKNGDLQQVRELLANVGFLVIALILGACAGRPRPQPPLLIAAYRGQVDEVKKLLKEGHGVNAGSGGYSALFNAATKGHNEIVRILLENGADPNLVTNKGFTALHVASRSDYLEIASLLLDKGADPNIKNTVTGLTPLLYSLEAKLSEETFELLSRFGISKELIFKHRENPKKLLQIALPIIMSTEGKSNSIRDIIRISQSLHARSPSIALELIKNGAEVNARSPLGQTPAILAAWLGEIEVLKELIKSGANLELQDVEGTSALVASIVNRDREIINLLLNNSVSTTSITTKDKITSLELAFIMEVLLEGSIGLEIIEKLIALEKRDEVLRRVKEMSIETKRQDITALIN